MDDLWVPKNFWNSPWIFLAEFKTSRCQEASQVDPQGMALLKATAQAGSPKFDADSMFPMKFWPFGGYILFSDTPMFILVTNCVFLAVDDLFLVAAGFWMILCWCLMRGVKPQKSMSRIEPNMDAIFANNMDFVCFRLLHNPNTSNLLGMFCNFLWGGKINQLLGRSYGAMGFHLSYICFDVGAKELRIYFPKQIIAMVRYFNTLIFRCQW